LTPGALYASWVCCVRLFFVASDWSYYLAGWFMVGTYSFSKEIIVGMSGLKSKR